MFCSTYHPIYIVSDYFNNIGEYAYSFGISRGEFLKDSFEGICLMNRQLESGKYE
jgi:hypothetical protein